MRHGGNDEVGETALYRPTTLPPLTRVKPQPAGVLDEIKSQIPVSKGLEPPNRMIVPLGPSHHLLFQ
jgi:hypothetical protein